MTRSIIEMASMERIPEPPLLPTNIYSQHIQCARHSIRFWGHNSE